MPHSMIFSLTKADLRLFMLTSMLLHANLHHYILSRVLTNVSAHFSLGRFFDGFFCVDGIIDGFEILATVTEPDIQLTDFLKLFLPDPKSFRKGSMNSVYGSHWMEILSSLVCKSLMIFYCMAAYIGSSISPAI